MGGPGREDVDVLKGRSKGGGPGLPRPGRSGSGGGGKGSQKFTISKAEKLGIREVPLPQGLNFDIGLDLG